MTTARAKKPAAAPTLSHASIASAALSLIDRDGLDAFSTRKLGRELHCEAMALYWYYPSKDALLDAVVDQLTAPLTTALTVTRAPADWIAMLRAVAHAYRQIALDHPRAFPLLATRRFASEATFQFMEQLFELAHRAGISDRLAARYYRVVSSYVNGFALNELATRDEDRAATTTLRKRFARVSAISRYLEADQLDDTFAFGLELQLSALARDARP